MALVPHYMLRGRIDCVRETPLTGAPLVEYRDEHGQQSVVVAPAQTGGRS